MPIGEAARRLGVAASTLRYYDDQGLVAPAARHGGRRWYGTSELRRLALIRMGQALGFSLDDARRLLRGGGEEFRAMVDRRIAELTEQIERAEEVRSMLRHARSCPSLDPVRECPHLHRALDASIAE